MKSLMSINKNGFWMKNFFFILIFSFLSGSIFAQEDNDDLDFVSLKDSKKSKLLDISGEDFSSVVFKLSFFMPSVAAEIKISEKFSFELASKLNFAIYISNPTTPQSLPKFYFFPLPVFHVEPKWNYNAVRRFEKNKKVSGFSSNFVSLFTSYRMKVSDETYHQLVIGPTWGIQRNMGKIGYLKFNAGLAYTHVFDPSVRAQFLRQSPLGIPVGPIVDIQLGIMF